MKEIIKKKKITIETSGSLKLKGGIKGPIEIPYMEEIGLIGRMLVSGYKIFEHLSSGKKIQLNTQNYNKENGKNDLYIGLTNVKPARAVKQQPSQTQQEHKKVFVPVIDNYEIKR